MPQRDVRIPSVEGSLGWPQARKESNSPQRTVWVAFARGEFFGEAEPPGPSSFVGVYATREEALKHCRPPGDSLWVEERVVEAA